MIAFVTGNLLSWLCVPLFIVVGLARAWQMYRYQQRNSRLTVEESVTWEKRYRIGSLATALRSACGALPSWSLPTMPQPICSA